MIGQMLLFFLTYCEREHYAYTDVCHRTNVFMTNVINSLLID